MTARSWNMVYVALSAGEMRNAPSPASEGRAKPCDVRISSPLKGNACVQKAAGSLMPAAFMGKSNLSRMYPFTIQWLEKGRFFPGCEKIFFGSQYQTKLFSIRRRIDESFILLSNPVNPLRHGSGRLVAYNICNILQLIVFHAVLKDQLIGVSKC